MLPWASREIVHNRHSLVVVLHCKGGGQLEIVEIFAETGVSADDFRVYDVHVAVFRHHDFVYFREYFFEFGALQFRQHSYCLVVNPDSDRGAVVMDKGSDVVFLDAF